MWHAAAYFDESDDNNRAYAVAGFMGHQHDCVHLELAWRERLLEKYGLEYFKASELEWGTGQFAKFRDDPTDLDARFSPREKNLFLEIKTVSIDIILEFDLLLGFGAVLMLPDYDRLVNEYKKREKRIPAPYFFCSFLVMMEAGLLINDFNRNSPPSQKGLVRPVFDNHDEYKGRVERDFAEFARNNPISSSNLLPPYFEDDKQYLMLQAADNLAYEARRLLLVQEYDLHIPERIAMKRLKERVHRIYKLNYAAMKMILETNNRDVLPISAKIDNDRKLSR